MIMVTDIMQLRLPLQHALEMEIISHVNHIYINTIE